ncbi:MAG: Formyltransferase family protein [Bacteroidota bacterium]|jgi:methionyl-tRNA formyltransferase|nr:Formyltransferase family protein [Bacteroidota bacterium]
MNVVLISSSWKGTLAHHLPCLINGSNFRISTVIINEGVALRKKNVLKKKLFKTLKIGFLGALNGIRIRKWFHQNVEKYITLADVRSLCEKQGIRLVVVNGINSNETKSILREVNPDLAVSLGNGYIAKSVFSIPKYGMINIHHELLPEYQNAQSVIWQLYNGSNETGFTIHKINERIDAGEILYRKRIKIEVRDTLSDTVSFTISKVLDASANALKTILEKFPEYYKDAVPQGEGRNYTTPSLSQFIRIYLNFRQLKKTPE